MNDLSTLDVSSKDALEESPTQDIPQRQSATQKHKLGVFEAGCWVEGRPRPPSPRAQAHPLQSYSASTRISLTAPLGEEVLAPGLGRGSCGCGGPSAHPSGRPFTQALPFLRTGSFLAGSVPTNSVPIQGA